MKSTKLQNKRKPNGGVRPPKARSAGYESIVDLSPIPADKPINPNLPPPYNRMTAARMDQEAAQYDGEIPDDRTRPLNAAEKVEYEQVRKDLRRGLRGRPRVGEGSRRIMVTMERRLLRRVDELASARGSNRSATIAKIIGETLDRKK
jgi:hypothetical protein